MSGEITFDVKLESNAQAAYDAFVKTIADWIDSWTHIILYTAKENVKYYPEAADLLRVVLATEASGLIEGSVVDDAWQAWLEQYGKGSEMDMSGNPYIADYVTSEYWNKLRSANPTIVGREAGVYPGLDGNTYASSGKLAGFNLEMLSTFTDFNEWMSAHHPDYDPSDLQPTPPTYFLSEALNSNRQSIVESLMHVILDFNWGKYLF